MDYREILELVRIRHELRRFALGGDLDEASALLSRLGALAAKDPIEHAAAVPELQRWRLRLGLQQSPQVDCQEQSAGGLAPTAG